MAIYTDLTKIDKTVTDIKAINNAIRNILFTPMGSLPGKPTFGSNLYKIIFSQLDHISEGLIKRYIKEALRKWETRIDIGIIDIQSSPEFNKIICTIFYTFRDKNIVYEESVSFNLAQ